MSSLTASQSEVEKTDGESSMLRTNDTVNSFTSATSSPGKLAPYPHQAKLSYQDAFARSNRDDCSDPLRDFPSQTATCTKRVFGQSCRSSCSGCCLIVLSLACRVFLSFLLYIDNDDDLEVRNAYDWDRASWCMRQNVLYYCK